MPTLFSAIGGFYDGKESYYRVDFAQTTETETTVTVDVDYEAVEPEVETVEEPVIEEKPKKKGFFGFFK